MKKAGIALMVIICLVLGAATVHLVITEDRTAPEIIFSGDQIHYSPEDDESVLLAGVTAMDKRDGDVTASLIVEGIYPDDSGSTAKVTYVARDKQNNIAKASREIEYSETGSTDTPNGNDAGNNIGETNQPTEGQNQTGSGQGEPNQDGTTPVSGAGIANTEDEEEEEDLPEGSPGITLSADKLTVKRGEAVNRLSYVESITDDKDDKNTLWQRISIAGDTLDTSTAGVYELQYYVIDTDGNQSNIATLTVTVQ